MCITFSYKQVTSGEIKNMGRAFYNIRLILIFILFTSKLFLVKGEGNTAKKCGARKDSQICATKFFDFRKNLFDGQKNSFNLSILTKNVREEYLKKLEATCNHGEKAVLIKERNALLDEIEERSKTQLETDILIERVKYMKKAQAAGEWAEKHRLTELLMEKEEEVYTKKSKAISKWPEKVKFIKKHMVRQKGLIKRMKGQLEMLLATEKDIFTKKLKAARNIGEKNALTKKYNTLQQEHKHTKLLMKREEEKYTKELNETMGWEQKHALSKKHNRLQHKLAKNLKLHLVGK